MEKVLQDKVAPPSESGVTNSTPRVVIVQTESEKDLTGSKYTRKHGSIYDFRK